MLKNQFLYYFKTPQDKSATGVIELSSSSWPQIETNKQGNRFQLVTDKRIFYLKAETEKQMQDWISEISGIIKYMKDEENQNMGMGSPRGRPEIVFPADRLRRGNSVGTKEQLINSSGGGWRDLGSSQPADDNEFCLLVDHGASLPAKVTLSATTMEELIAGIESKIKMDVPYQVSVKDPDFNQDVIVTSLSDIPKKERSS